MNKNFKPLIKKKDYFVKEMVDYIFMGDLQLT